MRVLVTGVTGFVGARVARVLLAQGDQVIGLAKTEAHTARIAPVRAQIDFHACDLADRAAVTRLLQQTKPEAAIHLAWYAEHGKYWTSPENFACVAQAGALAEALQAAGCRRLVAAGTCAEYDWSVAEHDETTTPCRPHTLYGAAKLGLYGMLTRFCAGAGMSFGWARYNFLYGPGEAPQRLVPSVMARLAAEENVPLTTGTQVRDFIHIDDGAAATVALAKSSVTGAVNIGAGTPVAVREVALEIARHLGGVERLQFGQVTPATPEPPRLVPVLQRLTAEVGWRPRYTLTTGIEQTVMEFNQARGGAGEQRKPA